MPQTSDLPQSSGPEVGFGHVSHNSFYLKLIPFELKYRMNFPQYTLFRNNLTPVEFHQPKMTHW